MLFLPCREMPPRRGFPIFRPIIGGLASGTISCKPVPNTTVSQIITGIFHSKTDKHGSCWSRALAILMRTVAMEFG
jgi:hypothetical protein